MCVRIHISLTRFYLGFYTAKAALRGDSWQGVRLL